MQADNTVTTAQPTQPRAHAPVLSPQTKAASLQRAAPPVGPSVAGAVSPSTISTPNQKVLDPQQTQLAQFEAFKTGSYAPAPSAAAMPNVSTHTETVPVSVVVHNGSASEHGVAATSTGNASGGAHNPAPAPTQAAASPSKPASGAVDPVPQAIALKAAPMTDQEEVNVVHLVTLLGVLARDQRTEIASLRREISGLSGKVNTQLTDFDRRLSIAEAKGAIDAAMGAGHITTEQTAGAALPSTPAPSARKVVAAAPAALVRHVSDYRIQAASPGLAMLSTTLDGGSHIQVAVGDEVPGIGHVQAVAQSGTSWEVKTDHGVIR
jgi:hypothetical protein